jgi:hypothetical protein
MRHALRSVPELILKSRHSDYTETLGAIAKNSKIVGSFMATIEKHPAIRTTPVLPPSDSRRGRRSRN